MEELFWQKDSLLKYTMTLLQGPKDPVLPTLMYIVCEYMQSHIVDINKAKNHPHLTGCSQACRLN